MNAIVAYDLLGPEVAKAICDRILGYYADASDHWTGLGGRQKRIRQLVEGKWEQVFQDDFGESELPKVANIFRTTTEDLGRLFAETMASERVFPLDEDDLKGAELREKALNAYTQGSHEFDRPRLEYRGQDMVAAGYTAIKVWPNFSEGPTKRFPRFSRIDPLHVLPEVRWRPDEPSDNVCVHYTDTFARLSKEFPDTAQRLLNGIGISDQVDPRGYNYDIAEMANATRRPPEITVLDWYSAKEIARVAVYTHEGRACSELLFWRLNETDICPMQLAYRPTWSSEPLGQLDDVRGIVQAKNRMWTILLDYFIDMVYGGKLVWNVRNPNDRGPNTVYYAQGPDGFMNPVTPQTPAFQALSLLSQIDTEARSGATSPASREGEVNLNKASAAFLSQAQGQYSSVVKSDQANYAAAKQFANVAAFEQDKAWCQASEKKIIGFARGRRFQAKYSPSDDIGENTANIVRYGSASGLDLPTHTVLMQNKYAQHTISLESLLENDPTIEDVPGEISRINSELIDQSFIAMLAQMAPLDRVEAIAELKEGTPIAEVARHATERQQAAAQANPLAQVAAAGQPALGQTSGVPGVGSTPGPTGRVGENVALPPTAALRAVS